MFANFIQTLRGTPEQEQGFVASPETIKARRAMARKLLEGSVDTSPVAHWTQGAARMAQALQGVTADWATDREEKSAQADAAKMYAGLPGMLGAPSVAANPAPVGNPMSGGGPVNINPQSGPVGTPNVPNDLASMFRAQEEENDLPPGFLARTAQIESSMNPQAKNPNSSAGGLFQFIDGTAADYNLGNKFDPKDATRAAAELAWDNKEALTKALGRDPTAAELYLAHQQGSGGASKLLANPSARAADIVGEQAVRLNGGDASMTAGDFAGKWLTKFDGARPSVQTAQASPQPTAAPQTGQQSEVFKRALTMMSSPAFQWLNPGQQAVVQNIVNKGMAQETADPVKQALTQEQLDAARMANAETRRRAGQTEMETQIIGGNLYEREKGSGGQWKMAVKKSAEDNPAKRSLQPIYGTNEAGETVLLQPDDAGNANQMKLPPGVKVANGIEKLDTGTEFILMDRKTGQVVGRQAKDVAGKEVQEAVGAAQGKIAAAAPNAISTAEQTLKEIQEVKKHPSNTDSMFGGGVGAPGVLFRSLPGTQAYGFNQRIEQLKGKTFMEAYNGLRGGGAITDAEGAKATQALARLNAAQSAKDFNEALGDLESIVTGGLARAKEMGARFGTVKPQQAAPSAPQVRKFNPATGAIE
jgi:hypothetical protein